MNSIIELNTSISQLRTSRILSSIDTLQCLKIFFFFKLCSYTVYSIVNLQLRECVIFDKSIYFMKFNLKAEKKISDIKYFQYVLRTN